MSTYKERLLEEKAQLDVRRTKLEEFLVTDAFQGIPTEQQRLLNVQAPIMLAYSQVLTERIALIPEEVA